MKSLHVLLIVNHPMMTDYTWTSGVKQFLSKYEFGYLWLQKNQTIKISSTTYYREL